MGAWGEVGMAVLRTAAALSALLAAFSATAALGMRALDLHVAGDGPLAPLEALTAGGYATRVLPAVQADLADASATAQQARARAATDPAGAAATLRDLAAHERDMAGRLAAESPPPAFAAAHHDLLALYADAARAAELGADCLAGHDPLAPACAEAARLQESLPGAVDRVTQEMQAAADGERALA